MFESDAFGNVMWREIRGNSHGVEVLTLVASIVSTKNDAVVVFSMSVSRIAFWNPG